MTPKDAPPKPLEIQAWSNMVTIQANSVGHATWMAHRIKQCLSEAPPTMAEVDEAIRDYGHAVLDEANGRVSTTDAEHEREALRALFARAIEPNSTLQAERDALASGEWHPCMNGEIVVIRKYPMGMCSMCVPARAALAPREGAK